MACLDNCGGKRDKWNVLIKPTHACNFNCQYCYDEPHRRKFKGTTMTMATLNKILKLASEYTNNLHIIWHGGEPTLVGIEWYEKAQKIIALYPNLKITQSIQTNGSLLNEEWAEFCHKYDVEIGVSFDSPEFQSVRNKDALKVERSINSFRNAGGRCGVITVINNENYKNMIDIYEYFKQSGYGGISFNRIFDTQQADINNLKIPVEEYNREMMKFYDYWIHDENNIEERMSQEITNHVFGLGSNICTHGDCRYGWLSFNPVGGIYPCDRYVPDDYMCGNVHDYDSIEEIYNSEGHKLYSENTEVRLKTCIETCKYAIYCGGGCVATHIEYDKSGKVNDPNICATYKNLFNDVYRYWRDLDIYSGKKINKYATVKLIETPTFTLKEIKSSLARLGYDPEKMEYVDTHEGLLECSEFKIFRMANPLRVVNLGEEHINYNIHSLDISIDLEDYEDVFGSIRDTRERVLDEIMKSHSERLNKILYSGGE